MNIILPKILAFITRQPRERVEDLKWGNLVTYNLFRLWELFFWRKAGRNGHGDTIRIEAVSTWNKINGRITTTRTFYTFESLICHCEGTLRNYLKSLFKFQLVYIPIPQFAVINATSNRPRGYMFAIATDAISNSGAKTGSSASLAHTITGSNVFLWVGVHTAEGTPPTVSTLKWNTSESLSQSDGAAIGSRGTEGWYLAAPSTGTHNIDTVLTDAGANWNFGGASYSGVRQTSPVDVHNKTSGTNTTFTVSLTTTIDNDWIVGMGAVSDVIGVGANTTSRVSITGLDSCALVDTNAAQTPAGSHSVVVTDTPSGDGALIAAAIKPLAATLTLAMAQGSYTYTGQLTGISFGRKMSLAFGSYTYSGFATVLTLFQKWIKQSKNTSTPTNQTKSSSSWTDQSKNSSSSTNQTKN